MSLGQHGCRGTGKGLTCALAAVGRVSVVPRHAVLTLLPGGEVPALLAHVVADARAVSVTLAG